MERIAILDYESHTLFVEDISDETLARYNGDEQAYIDDNYGVDDYSWDYVTANVYTAPDGESTCGAHLKLMGKVWLVKQESCVDGEILFDVVPCASEKMAKEVMAQKVKTLLNEGHFSNARPFIEGEADMEGCVFEWENDVEGKFYISDFCSDYYEHIEIEEKEIHP